MNRTPHLRRRAAAAALLVVLAFGACGADDGAEPSADAGSSETSDTTAAPADDSGGNEATEGDKVAIKDFNYTPSNLKVKVGTEVTFTNEDKFAHTVTAKDKSFDSENMDEGADFTHTFDKAGTFDYICTIHNSMTGTVTVA